MVTKPLKISLIDFGSTLRMSFSLVPKKERRLIALPTQPNTIPAIRYPFSSPRESVIIGTTRVGAIPPMVEPIRAIEIKLERSPSFGEIALDKLQNGTS